MRLSVHITRVRSDEHGAIIVMVALWLPVLLIFMTFVVDMGNWFVHKRHLQMQADAAVFAAAEDYKFPCSDAPILQKTDEYSGSAYNAQIGGTPASRVHRLVNSKTFYNQPAKSDDTVENPPCTAGMIDVKMTETDLPWYFKPIAGLLGSGSPIVPFINAQARIAVNQLETSTGSLPLGVPDVNPKAAKATFINEATGAVLGSTNLTKAGTSNGLVVWDNAGAPLPVTFASDAVNVGVVVALSGQASTTTCGQPLVDCYDAGAAKLASGLPAAGIIHVRGWSAAGSGAQPADPILRQVELVPGSCSDPYFSSAATSCTVGVRASADFGTVNGSDQTSAVGAILKATVNGSSYTLTYNSTTKVWSSPTTIPVPTATGPIPVTMSWEEQIGTHGTAACNNKNTNPCKGNFSGVAQRTFAGSDTRSGPIKVAQVSENGLTWANSLERCSSVQTSCTHNLVVRVGVTSSLGNASSVDDPIVALRVVGGSQNQSLDCDPVLNQLNLELAQGCSPTYGVNHGTACPSSTVTLWASPQPYRCVPNTTGGRVNDVPKGLNERILGSQTASTCSAPNHWSQYPDLPSNDPRLLQVFITPFGSFSGTGSATVPVIGFATFYVTGWTASGGGFANPCQGNGDDPVPGNDAGNIVGHFVKYIQTFNSGSAGTAACDTNAFDTCVAVMTR